MKCLYLLACALFVCFGCAADGDKDWRDEVRKDWQGDNMRMHTDMQSMANGNTQH